MGKDKKGKELGTGLRQRSDGKFVARFKCKSGKRPEKAFDKLSEAKMWLNEQRYLSEHNDLYEVNGMTLNTWYEYWIENIKKPTVRDTTIRTYEDRYRLIKPRLGNMMLSDIKPLHCQMVLNEINASQNTQKLTRVCMHQLFESAIDNGLIDKSPVTKNVKCTKTEKKERRVFTASEQDMFVKYLLENHHPNANEFIFCLETGLRVGELRGLMWCDVSERKIVVQRTMETIGKVGDVIHEPKTKAGKRVVPLTTRAYEIIKDCRSQKVVGQYVFHDSPKTVEYNKKLATICKRMGIENISMHGLRHSFATRCIERGMRPKTLQKILGHSTLQMTMDLYVHVTDETLEEEMLKLERGETVAK